MSKVSYTAIVLDELSKSRLKESFWFLVPDRFEWIGHHCTLCMGALPEPDRSNIIGKRMHLHVQTFGYDDKVIAVGVVGAVGSKNKTPHITLGVNRTAGGKPYMSNNLTNWNDVPVENEILLNGTVEEIMS